MVEKCRFLMTEVRPYYKSLQGLHSLRLLYKEPRLKTVARRIIRERRAGGVASTTPPTTGDTGGLNNFRPEDILNASIQSQELLLSAGGGGGKISVSRFI